MNDEINLGIIIDRCLAGMADGASVEECLERYPEWRDELAPALRAAERLRALPRVEPSPAFRQQSKARLMAAFSENQQEPVTNATTVRLSRQRELDNRSDAKRRVPMSGIAALLALALTLFGGGGVVASQDALPGEPLYRVKTFVEAARLNACTGEEACLAVNLELAQKRLMEAEQVAQRDNAEALLAVLNEYQIRLRALEMLAVGMDQENLEAQEQFRAQVEQELQVSLGTLSALRQRTESLSAEERAAVEEALQFTEQLRERLQDGEDTAGKDAEQNREEEQNRNRETPTSTPAPAATSTATVTPEPEREQNREEDGAGAQEQNQEREQNRTGAPEESDSSDATVTPGEQLREREQAEVGPVATATPEQAREQEQAQTEEQEQNREQEQEQSQAGNDTPTQQTQPSPESGPNNQETQSPPVEQPQQGNGEGEQAREQDQQQESSPEQETPQSGSQQSQPQGDGSQGGSGGGKR